jgi:hypothetical protein
MHVLLGDTIFAVHPEVYAENTGLTQGPCTRSGRGGDRGEIPAGLINVDEPHVLERFGGPSTLDRGA